LEWHPVCAELLALTAHIGSATHMTRRAMAQLAVDNLMSALGHGPDAGHPPNLIHPPS